MSLVSTVRPRLLAFSLVVLGVASLAPRLSGAPQDTESQRQTTPTPTVETTVPAVRQVVQREPIPYTTSRKASPLLRSGASRTVRPGANGEKEVVYRVYSRTDGVELRREVASTKVVKQPVPEVVEEGQRTTLPSRGGYTSGRRMVTMIPTWYDPYNCGGDGRGITATGIKARYGVAAVDPKFIPLGTRLYVEGYGYAVAADTGGAIKGNRIDLCIDSRNDPRRFRVKSMKPVRVYILD